MAAMTTVNPLPLPTVPARGLVQRTWVDVRVLAGFTDQNHFQGLVGEYLATLDAVEQQQVLAAAQAAREAAKALQEVPLADVVVRQAGGSVVEGLLADPLFMTTFQARPFGFQYVRADRLIAVQATVNPRHDLVPDGEDELLAFCLPHRWDVPAEISFVPPAGPIQITSSSPTLQTVKMEMERATGKVTLAPAPHINLVQVQEFNGRFYLRNGYHRVYDLLSAGRVEIPALVSQALAPQEVELGPAGFGIGYTMGLARPPLVADLLGPSTIKTKVRERRYGVAINLDFKQFNIGI